MAYDKYLAEIIGVDNEEQDKVNSKKLFSFLKHSRQDNQGISPLQSDGKLVTDTTDKANALNKQFHSVFTPKSPLSLASLCQVSIQNFNDSTHIHLPTTETNNTPIMPDFNISTAGILKLLKDLNPNKAAGPDKIKPLVLQELKDQ